MCVSPLFCLPPLSLINVPFEADFHATTSIQMRLLLIPIRPPLLTLYKICILYVVVVGEQPEEAMTV